MGRTSGCGVRTGFPALRRIALFVFIAVSSLGTPHAQAEWRYTHWGMSRAELIKASNGTATVYRESQAESWGEYPAAKANVAEMGQSLEAWFYIDPHDGLYAIRLVPTGMYWCIDVRDRAMQRWGYARLLDGDFQMYWAKPDANNRISIIGFRGCSIKFEPLDPEMVGAD